jgi:hypothetical protein
MLIKTLQHASGGPASSTSEIDSYLGSLTELSPLAPEMAGPQPEPHDIAEARGLGCVRGLRYAVAAEVVAVVLLYGLWRLAHMLF